MPQRFKVAGWIWRDSSQDERTAALRAEPHSAVRGRLSTAAARVSNRRADEPQI